jgi:hypothetical protein
LTRHLKKKRKENDEKTIHAPAPKNAEFNLLLPHSDDRSSHEPHVLSEKNALIWGVCGALNELTTLIMR